MHFFTSVEQETLIQLFSWKHKNTTCNERHYPLFWNGHFRPLSRSGEKKKKIIFLTNGEIVVAMGRRPVMALKFSAVRTKGILAKTRTKNCQLEELFKFY
jgi:hypothetical protein